MRFPDDTQRISIIGSTGSGKTQAALWHLSHRRFDLMPWLILNFKGDESIDGIPYARHIDVDEVPVQPGVYISHPLPHEEDRVEAQLWAIWERGNTGVYVDEGYMMGRNNRAFRAILTQGRSKHIPTMVLTQRPTWIDTFIFTESEFFQVFRLQHRNDKKRVAEFSPINIETRIPDFHSYYYDVGANDVTFLRPVPSLETIHLTFERRLERKKNVV